MLIKTQPTSPLQMFYEFIVQSKEARPISIALKAMGLVLCKHVLWRLQAVLAVRAALTTHKLEWLEPWAKLTTL